VVFDEKGKLYDKPPRNDKPDFLAKISSNKPKVELDKAANADTPIKRRKKETEV
jgi:hypothetical protein